MALDSNLLDDSAPSAKSVDALRPKRKRIKPWQDVPAESDNLRTDRDDALEIAEQIKYGQHNRSNEDKPAVKYGQGGLTTDKKYGHNADRPRSNTDNSSRKYGQVQDAPLIGAADNVSKVVPDPIPHDKHRAQEANQIRTPLNVPISDERCLHLHEALSVNDLISKPTNTDKFPRPSAPVSNKNAVRPDLQIKTTATLKCGQIVPPPSPQKLAILQLLQVDQDLTGLGHTRMLSTTWIAQQLGLSVLSVRKQLDRMKAEGRIERVDGRRGRGAAGCTYRVSLSETSALKSGKYGQTQGSNKDNKYGQFSSLADSSSKSLSNKTTTKADDRRSLIERFDLLVDDIGVDSKYRVDGTDLLGWWQKVEKEYKMDIEDFEESFERWVFKVNSAPIREGVSPKAVLSGKILSGPCGRPAGFVSRSERKTQELAQMRSERIAKTRRQMLSTYNDDFELWFAESEDEVLLHCVPHEDGQRKRVQPETGCKVRRSPMLKGLVRAEYAKSQGIDLTHWDHLTEELG